jgi:proline-specific peptidase
MPFRGGHTWYRIAGTGDLAAGKDDGSDGALPLVLLHGGPGAGHDYLLPVAELFGTERAVVLYDQTGSGNSTPRPDWPDESFIPELFREELRDLTAHLGLRRFHLFGHSWGGILATEYALAHPEQLASLTLCSTAASTEVMTGSLLSRYKSLEDDGITPEQFGDVFVARHICRITPLPEGLVRSLTRPAENPKVNHAMMASDENGRITGTLRDWTSVDRLPRIPVPTLVMHGEFDELDASAHQPFLDSIPDVRGHVFLGASHTPFSESPAEFSDVLGPFLAENDVRS